jgi:Zn-dependent peptidase ImmA (M78 family)
MLFDLAHELGHIARGHLKASDDGVFVDRKIDSDATADLEGEANSYAFGLLSGMGRLNCARNREIPSRRSPGEGSEAFW